MHRHRWKIISQKFQPPRNFPALSNATPELLEMWKQAFYGYTNTAMQCEKCGKLKSYMNLGNIT